MNDFIFIYIYIYNYYYFWLFSVIFFVSDGDISVDVFHVLHPSRKNRTKEEVDILGAKY